jgi:hypothetical protein
MMVIIVIMIMEHECERGVLFGGSTLGKREKEKDIKE